LTDHDLEAIRTRGFGAAYRMLGSVSEAEDIAQEAMLRFTTAGDEIDDPLAWITTVSTRLSIDYLRTARVRRETYIGPWLPEPLVADPEPGPGQTLELADTLSQAFLVMLERLTPLERAAFLLRDVFDYDYAELAAVLDRNEANCRQLVARARRHAEAEDVRYDPDAGERDRLFDRFLAAAAGGNVNELERLLAEDAVFVSDGGGKVTAARKPLFGAHRVASVWARITANQRRHERPSVARVSVNGQPGCVLRRPGGEVTTVLTVDVIDGRIAALRAIRNPDKLAHV